MAKTFSSSLKPTEFSQNLLRHAKSVSANANKINYWDPFAIRKQNNVFFSSFMIAKSKLWTRGAVRSEFCLVCKCWWDCKIEIMCLCLCVDACSKNTTGWRKRTRFSRIEIRTPHCGTNFVAYWPILCDILVCNVTLHRIVTGWAIIRPTLFPPHFASNVGDHRRIFATHKSQIFNK